MPIVRPVEEEREQIYLPSREYKRDAAGALVLDDKGKAIAASEDERAWVVMDVSPAMGRDLVEIQSKDPTGLTVMKTLLRRLVEWNFYQEGTTPWPITLENMQGLLDIDDINFLNAKVKASTTPKPLSETEKKA